VVARSSRHSCSHHNDTVNVLRVQSAPPDTMPVGPDHATQRTFSLCSSRVCKGMDALMSHSFRVLSCEAETRWCSEVGCHATPEIQSVWEVYSFSSCTEQLPHLRAAFAPHQPASLKQHQQYHAFWGFACSKPLRYSLLPGKVPWHGTTKLKQFTSVTQVKTRKAGKGAAGTGWRTFSFPAGVRGSQMCSERSAPPKATSCEPAGAAATQYTALDASWRSVHVHISASHLLTCPRHMLKSGQISLST
jgi:hypothetical protein